MKHILMLIIIGVGIFHCKNEYIQEYACNYYTVSHSNDIVLIQQDTLLGEDSVRSHCEELSLQYKDICSIWCDCIPIF